MNEVRITGLKSPDHINLMSVFKRNNVRVFEYDHDIRKVGKYTYHDFKFDSKLLPILSKKWQNMASK